VSEPIRFFSDFHPYECDPDRCRHCKGTKDATHDPATCALCADWRGELEEDRDPPDPRPDWDAEVNDARWELALRDATCEGVLPDEEDPDEPEARS